MKNIFLIAALAGLVLFPSCYINGGTKIKYTKLPAEGKNMPVQPFTSINAVGVFNIILQSGSTESVVVKNEFPEDLKISNNGDTLVITDTISNHNNNGNHITIIYVTYKQLKAIKTESVGQIKTIDTIKANTFTFEGDGVGENILFINADSVNASENGVGALVIAGRSRYANIEDNGVGALKASDFKVSILHATVSGVGAAKVYADSAIYLNVSGVGGVKYYGPAKVMEKTTGGIGKIEHGE